jgi:hypothetical protein
MIKRASVFGRYSLIAVGLTVCLIGVVLAHSIRARRVLSQQSDKPGVSVNAGTATQNVIILGTAVWLSPPRLTFGSSPQRVTVTNGGTSTLHLWQIEIVGANAGDFSKTTTCGSILAVGANCTVSVTFKPKAAGARAASLLFSDDAGGSPQAVGLTGTGQFMVLDQTKTYLVNTFTGKPVFMSGDTAYDLAIQLSSNSDVETYLSDRQAKGINLIWVALVDNCYHGASCGTENDASGNNPWNGGATFTGMSGATAYWSHVDYVVQRAAAYGITVLAGTAFAGCWGGCGSGGYGANLESSSDATVQAYGAFLGNRYKNCPNIIWLIGGDSYVHLEGSALQNKENDLAVGTTSVDQNHLMTVEESTYDNTLIAARMYWSSYAWFNLNTIYPKHISGGVANNMLYCIAQASKSYQESLQPTFSIEDIYDFEGSITRRQLRQEGYYEILSGATLGRLFGSGPIWVFDAPCCRVSGQTWKGNIDASASVDQQLLGQLFRSREHWKMAPDVNHRVVTAGYGSGDTITVTSRTSDGQTIIAYIPNGNAATLTVDMSKVTSSSNTAKCWWFNPSSGATTLMGSYANSGTQDFTPPDSNDWVLVIDDADANLPAPGSADL